MKLLIASVLLPIKNADGLKVMKVIIWQINECVGQDSRKPASDPLMIADDCINLYGSTYNCPPPGLLSNRGGRTCLLGVLIFGLWIACAGGLNSQIVVQTKALLVLLETVSFRFCMHSKMLPLVTTSETVCRSILAAHEAVPWFFCKQMVEEKMKCEQQDTSM